MYSFKNDYSEGAHPAILEALIQYNLDQEDGYGEDSHTLNAAKMIKELADDPGCAVHLLSGGTQTNLLAVSSFLRPHEACIAADSGHISTHETGAIEATGHKIITLPGRGGKITPGDILSALEEHHFEHMVKPRMVYISQPTEMGTIYSAGELEAVSRVCHENQLYLYIDGARLGSALTAEGSDFTLPDINRFSDAFFIGGTKNGTLLGEALVISNPALQADMRYLLKQKGALMAKGRVLGIQFEELFRDGLFFRLAEHSNLMADRLRAGLAAQGCSFLIPTKSNQVFPVMSHEMIDSLHSGFGFYVWQKIDENHSAIRLITSWATTEEAVDRFISALEQLQTAP